jgi:hypothetical protein
VLDVDAMLVGFRVESQFVFVNDSDTSERGPGNPPESHVMGKDGLAYPATS